MENLRYRQLARIGMVYLEEAILDVLFEAKQEAAGRTPASISKKLGIPRCTQTRNYPIVYGVLHKLEEVDGLAERCPGRSQSWQLTEKGLRNYRPN